MSTDQWIGIAFIVGAIGISITVFWLCIATTNEAERRLGRDLYFIEILIAAMAFPYSLAMVWFALPDKSQKAS